jgi:hypothetical protein
MKKIVISVFFSLVIIHIDAQCDCEKIQRSDEIITMCKTLPIAGDNSLQVGLSLAYNGRDIFVNSTIRFLSNDPLKIIGDLSLRLVDNNLLTFKLVKTQGSYIGNNEVEIGVFNIDEYLFTKIRNSKILTVTLVLSDNKMHTLEATVNQDILINQAKCLK